MFKINVKFLGKHPPRAAYSKMSIDDIYAYLSWEADLTITYNNEILFSEDVAVIEFYWYLVSWYRRYLAGDNVQFNYTTVEYTEPILVFSYQQNHYWRIDSVWRQCDEPALIKDEMLCSEVQRLVDSLMIAIED